MQSPGTGHTLPEVLILLAVVLLMFGIAAPDLQATLQRHAGEALVSELARTLNLARAAAVNSGSMVTLCRSTDGLTCSGDWLDGILVFTDANADRVINAEDSILRYTNAFQPVGVLRFRSFPNRQYLQFTQLGFTNNQNGNFTWCPATGEAASAQQLIFTQSGRSRFAKDKDGDGIREGADGQAISCGN